MVGVRRRIQSKISLFDDSIEMTRHEKTSGLWSAGGLCCACTLVRVVLVRDTEKVLGVICVGDR
jgi:hypothetical protein